MSAEIVALPSCFLVTAKAIEACPAAEFYAHRTAHVEQLGLRPTPLAPPPPVSKLQRKIHLEGLFKSYDLQSKNLPSPSQGLPTSSPPIRIYRKLFTIEPIFGKAAFLKDLERPAHKLCDFSVHTVFDLKSDYL